MRWVFLSAALKKNAPAMFDRHANISDALTRVVVLYNAMNVPNILTISRVIAIPFFIVALMYGHNGAALAIFVIAGLTDAFDGFIARAYHQRTNIGAFLDPLADKLMLTSTVISLSLVSVPNTLPLWFAVTLISRDIMITVGIAALFMLGVKFPIAPSIIGKLTTFLQVALISVVLFYNYLDLEKPGLIHPFCWITFVVTVTSGLGYVYRGIRLFNSSTENIERPSSL